MLVECANYSQGIWTVIVRTDRTTRWLGRLEGCDSGTCSFARVAKLDPTRLEPVSLTSVGTTAIVSYINPPFGLVTVDYITHRTLKRAIRVSPPLSSTGWWVAMPVLALDSGFLMTISDLRSDSRKLIVLDQGFATTRLRDIVSPLAFAFSDPSTHQLVAVIAGEPATIVTYGWRWRAAAVHAVN